MHQTRYLSLISFWSSMATCIPISYIHIIKLSVVESSKWHQRHALRWKTWKRQRGKASHHPPPPPPTPLQHTSCSHSPKPRSLLCQQYFRQQWWSRTGSICLQSSSTEREQRISLDRLTVHIYNKNTMVSVLLSLFVAFSFKTQNTWRPFVSFDSGRFPKIYSREHRQ